MKIVFESHYLKLEKNEQKLSKPEEEEFLDPILLLL